MSGSFDVPSIFHLDLDAETIPQLSPESIYEDESAIEACCDQDTGACERFSIEVEEMLVNITTLDVVTYRDRSIQEDYPGMGEGPFFAYCEPGDASRSRSTSPQNCGNPETASFLYVYAEFLLAGRHYRVLVDHQWDVFVMAPPRVESFDGNNWTLVVPRRETNTGDERCERHHYNGSFRAHWSEQANVLVIGYGLEGPSQSHCQPGLHYMVYAL